MGVWKAFGVVASNELLHDHVRCRGDLRQDRAGITSPVAVSFEETLNGCIEYCSWSDFGWVERKYFNLCWCYLNRRVGLDN